MPRSFGAMCRRSNLKDKGVITDDGPGRRFVKFSNIQIHFGSNRPTLGTSHGMLSPDPLWPEGIRMAGTRGIGCWTRSRRRPASSTRRPSWGRACGWPTRDLRHHAHASFGPALEGLPSGPWSPQHYLQSPEPRGTAGRVAVWLARDPATWRGRPCFSPGITTTAASLSYGQQGVLNLAVGRMTAPEEVGSIFSTMLEALGNSDPAPR